MLPGVLATAILLGSAAGCLPGPVNLPGVGGDEYARQLDRWTRSEEVYRRFEAKIFVTATYHAPDFRAAYVRKRTAILGLPQRDAVQLEAEQRHQAESFHEFFVFIYTADRRWNDLDKKSSIWRVTLQNDRQEQVEAEQVIRVNPRNAEVTAFYPYLNSFGQGYLIRFPRTSLELNSPIIDDSVHTFKLMVSSSVAVAELSWELEAPRNAKGQVAEAPREDKSPEAGKDPDE